MNGQHYELRVRTETGDWTQDAEQTAQYIGGTAAENTFATEQEAEQMIRQLRTIDGGANGWGDLEAIVVAVPVESVAR